MIRGNGDVYLLRLRDGSAPEAWFRSKAFATVRWFYRHTGRNTLDFLDTLPEQRTVSFGEAPPIRVVHGSPRRLDESIFPESEPAVLELALASIEEPVMICGHTHLPWQYRRNGRLAVNPGAVCGPLDGTIGAQYALLTWVGGGWVVDHRLVPYDVNRVRQSYRASGLLEEGGAFARSIVCCIESGRNVTQAFLDHAKQLALQAGVTEKDFVPDALWDQAAATFPWPDQLA